MNTATLPQSDYWWTDKDLFSLQVTSTGVTAAEWGKRYYNSQADDTVQQILLSEHLKSTHGVISRIAILQGAYFKYQVRMAMRKMYDEGVNRQLLQPTIETMCLVREKITDKDMLDMGLEYIVAMHDPVWLPGSPHPFLMGIYPKSGSALKAFILKSFDEEWTLEKAGFLFIDPVHEFYYVDALDVRV